MQLLADIAPYRHLGIEPPPLHLLINRVHPVSANARLIQQALRDLFRDHAGIGVLATDVPAIELIRVPRRAVCRCIGHTASQWAESSRRARHHARSCRRLFPSGRIDLPQVSGRPPQPLDTGRPMANHMNWPEATAGCAPDRVRRRRRLARQAHGGQSPQVHQGRLRRDLTSSTASDHRAALNARAQIRRAERET